MTRDDAYTRQHDPASTAEDCPKCQEVPSWHADLHVGHIWTNTRCPAYRSMDGAECDCQTSATAH